MFRLCALFILLVLAIVIVTNGLLVGLAVIACAVFGIGLMILVPIAVVVQDDYFQKRMFKRVTAEALSGD